MKILRPTIESVLLLLLAVFFFVLPFTLSHPLPLHLQVGVVWVGLCFLQVVIHHAWPAHPIAGKVLTVLRYCAHGLFAAFFVLALCHYLGASW